MRPPVFGESGYYQISRILLLSGLRIGEFLKPNHRGIKAHLLDIHDDPARESSDHIEIISSPGYGNSTRVIAEYL
jgi:hypothetical protein